MCYPWFLRASTLLQVSCPIGRPMQCHIRFLMMWRRESEERERGRCFTKQPPHERNSHLMRQLHNHCLSCCCHAIHNIPFLYAQIKGFYYSTRWLIRQLIVQVLYWVDPILCVNACDDLSDDTNVLALTPQALMVMMVWTQGNFASDSSQRMEYMF
jgi:hypothetical protein